MSERAKQFSRVLDRMGFVESAPPELQKYIRDIKRRQFLKTLRRTGSYGAVFAAVSYIYFTLKKLGISITIYKSAAILALGSSMAAVSIGAGGYLAVKKFTAPPGKIRIERIMQDEKPSAAEDVPGLRKEKKSIVESADTLEKIQARIGVQKFDSANANDALSGRVTDMIAAGLAALRGAEYVINARKQKGGKRSGMILKGSVEFLRGGYTITARVVDVNTLRVIYYASEPASSEKDIDSACRRIAEKIAASRAVPRTETTRQEN